jgi:Heterokaryon incompatibility protein (HET)
VLDVKYAKNPNNVFLYYTKGEKGKYVALSHCWGDGKPLSTTSYTKAARCEEIKFDDLPKTFQDAVVVTRELGV